MASARRIPRTLIRLALPVLSLTSAAAGAQADASLRTLPAQVQADVAAIAEHLSSVQEPAPVLDCDKAVENARWGVDTMLEVSGKNLRSGYLSQAATGARRDFYQCMSSDYNHVYACGKAHPFEP